MAKLALASMLTGQSLLSGLEMKIFKLRIEQKVKVGCVFPMVVVSKPPHQIRELIYATGINSK